MYKTEFGTHLEKKRCTLYYSPTCSHLGMCSRHYHWFV